MTKQEFIAKWNVGYEDKEEQSEFANEMLSDLDKLIYPEKQKTEERLSIFAKEILAYESVYGREMLRAFYEYWSELNRSKSKFLAERQPTWELHKRLKRWARSSKVGNSQESRISRISQM